MRFVVSASAKQISSASLHLKKEQRSSTVPGVREGDSAILQDIVKISGNKTIFREAEKVLCCLHSCAASQTANFGTEKLCLGCANIYFSAGYSLYAEDGSSPAVHCDTSGSASYGRDQQGFFLKTWCWDLATYVLWLHHSSFHRDLITWKGRLLVSPGTFLALADPSLEFREAEDTFQVTSIIYFFLWVFLDCLH